MSDSTMHEAYDIIVIGSGLAGLSAGALLAKAGKKVLVLEQHDRAGGYAQSFTRRGFRFDSSIHFSGGCLPMEDKREGIISKTLELLNVRDSCLFYPLEPFIRLSAPGFTFEIPTGRERFVKACADICPHEARRITRLVDLCHALDIELRKLPLKLTVWDMISMPFRFPLVCRYGAWTLQKGLEHFLTDARIKAVFAAISACFATPPSRISFALWTHLVVSLIHEKAAYCKGTFQQLADTFAEALRSYGGTLRLKTPVQSIIVENRKAGGVVLHDGTRILAPVVIANCDLVNLYKAMVDRSQLPAGFIKRLDTLKPSLSCFSVYIGTDLPLHELPVTHENMVLYSLDYEKCYNQLESSDPQSFIIAIPSLTDPGIAPQGMHAISIVTFVPYTPELSPEKRELLKNRLIQGACKIIPGLDKHILFADTATPLTFERYTGNHKGASLGWETSPAQSGYRRPSQQSPVRGLYHAGHWTRPGGGVYGTIVSGRQVAQLILGYRRAEDFIEAIERVT